MTGIGVNPSGQLEVPENFDEVGWFEFGPRPGESGNTILAGHFDRTNGAAAIFYNLRKLAPGDEVQVEDERGKIYTYEVYESRRVLVKSPEAVARAYAESSEPILALITCGGVWDPQAHNYNKRVLVKAHLL